MINRDEAIAIASQYLRDQKTNVDPNNLTIIHDYIRETSFGWVFSWNDRRYLESGDHRYAMCDNHPFVVLCRDGKVVRLPTLNELGLGKEGNILAIYGTFDERIQALADKIKRETGNAEGEV